ncbi:MAG: VCBS repeat-containing protein [Sulfuricella denitrificans]|nr:VCBS repeat-containing protein [Sulfuricella denitrificans]
MTTRLTRYSALLALLPLLAGCLQATVPAKLAEPEGPATREIQIDAPWSASAIVTPAGETLIAAISHRDNYLEIWQLTPDRKLVRLAQNEATNYHPDSVRWASPTELYVAAEGTSKVQRWSFNDKKLGLAQIISADHPPIALTLGDLDQDGQLDVISGPYIGDTLTIFWGQADGQFKTQYLAGDKVPQYARIVDWDGDGKPDLIWSEYDAGSIRFARNLGQRKFELSLLQKAGPGKTRQLAAGDLDNDGHPDLVVALETGKAARILFNDGKGGVRDTLEIPAPLYGYSAVAIGHEHGQPLLALSENGRVVLARPKDGKPHEAWERRGLSTGALPLDMQFIDLDRDGHLDLLVANSADTTVQLIFGPLWENAKPIP